MGCDTHAMTDTPENPAETTPESDAEREARAALDAIPGINWRPFERDDLPAIAEFYAEVEAFDRKAERTSLSGLQEFWDSPRSVPSEDTLAGYDSDGRVMAIAWSGCNRSVTERRSVFLGGAVRPDRRGEGIGHAVLAWDIAHGRAWDRATREPGFGPLLLRLWCPVDQADVRDLADRAGLHVERHFFEMSRPLTDVPESVTPDGIRITGWDPDRTDEVLQVVNAAFRDHWGYADASAEMWADNLAASSFRSKWSCLAIDEETDRIVGVAFNCAYEQDWSEDHRGGCTDKLVVLREYRGRGIAHALLIESMRRFAAASMDAAALGVDAENPSGALGLYESLGYVNTASTCVHQREEHPAV